MAVTILDVQVATHDATTNTLALPPFAVNPSNGDTVIVAYAVWTTPNIQQAPTDSTGANTYTRVGLEVVHGVPEIIGLWYAHNITGGSSFVVTGHLASNQYHTVIAWLISGDYIYNSDTVNAGGGGGTNPLSSGTSTPAPSGEAIFIGAMSYDTSTAATDGSGWNTTGVNGFTSAMQGRSRNTSFSNIDLYTEYLVATAAAQAATWGIAGTHNYNALVASFSQNGSVFNQALAGSLSFAGSLGTATAFTKALTAALTFSGAVSRRVGKTMSGAVSFVGTIGGNNVFSQVMTAALTFTGSVTKRTSHALSGAVSFVGSVTSGQAFIKLMTASLGFSGSLRKTMSLRLSGALSFIGSLFTGFSNPMAVRIQVNGQIRQSQGMDGTILQAQSVEGIIRQRKSIRGTP